MSSVVITGPQEAAKSATWGQSMAGGAPGIALLHIERAHAGLADWKPVHQLARAMTREPIHAHPDNTNLFYGAPAVAYALHAAGQPAYRAALATLDRSITDLIHDRLTAAHRRINEGLLPAAREYDLINGLTGFGAYLLHRDHDHGLLRDVLAYLVRLTEAVASELRPCRAGGRPAAPIAGRCDVPRNGFRSALPRRNGGPTVTRSDGPAGMTDRSSRRHHSPGRTPQRTEQRIIKIRVLHRWGPARIGYLLGLNPATVHRVLTRYHCARLAHLDRGTGRVIRRYQHEHPGDLIHVDIKKLGNIPDGGGHRIHGRSLGTRQRSAHRDTTRPRKVGGRPNLGYHYLHNAVDDHSRLAYTEILPDETRETATAFWQRAHAWFASIGITVRRVLIDNGSCYRSHLWRDTLAEAKITHKRTRPYRPRPTAK